MFYSSFGGHVRGCDKNHSKNYGGILGYRNSFPERGRIKNWQKCQMKGAFLL